MGEAAGERHGMTARADFTVTSATRFCKVSTE
jgi:hypothetical protein